jgi:hypothetical protein
MPLFGHRHEPPPPPPPSGNPVTIPDGASYAASQGWQPIAGLPFIPSAHTGIRRASLAMYGAAPRGGFHPVTGDTWYADTYRLNLGGRTVVVANSTTDVEPSLLPGLWHSPHVRVCAVEVPTLLPMSCVQPRAMEPVYTHYHQQTGSPAFDATYLVVGGFGDLLRQLLTVQVQQRIMARDDWVFWFEDTQVICIGKGHFQAGYEMGQWVAETMGIVAALPESLVPRQVDHSTDDLMVRIRQLDSIEDAMAFLQGLTPDERARLARSNSPLAVFADARTPAEAIARLQSLDIPRRMQLLAMFSNAR